MNESRLSMIKLNRNHFHLFVKRFLARTCGIWILPFIYGLCLKHDPFFYFFLVNSRQFRSGPRSSGQGFQAQADMKGLTSSKASFTSTSIFFSLKNGVSWGCLIDGGLQDRARFKCQDLSGGNRYQLAGQGVPSLAAFLLPDDKSPETGNLHVFSRLKGLLDCFQDCFQIREGFISCEPGIGVYLIYEVCFCHAKLTLCS